MGEGTQENPYLFPRAPFSPRAETYLLRAAQIKTSLQVYIFLHFGSLFSLPLSDEIWFHVIFSLHKDLDPKVAWF